MALFKPATGATVATTFKVRFGVQGMTVAPAGDIVRDGSHNHLLINRMPVTAGESVPFDDNHRHFGASQTEAMVTLPPGQYKLQVDITVRQWRAPVLWRVHEFVDSDHRQISRTTFKPGRQARAAQTSA